MWYGTAEAAALHIFLCGTYLGDFVSAIKNDGIWSKIKQTFSADQLADLPLDVIKSIGIDFLAAWAKGKMGL